MEKKRWAAAVLGALAIMAVLAAIWHFSAQPGTQSAALSRSVQKALQQKGLSRLTPGMGIFNVQQAVRKWAHVYIYTLLGAAAALEYRLLEPIFPRKARKRRLIHPALFCLLTAVSDECHQLFVPGRSGQPRDVGVDMLGAAAGILLLTALGALAKILIRRFPGK